MDNGLTKIIKEEYLEASKVNFNLSILPIIDLMYKGNKEESLTNVRDYMWFGDVYKNPALEKSVYNLKK